MLLWVVATVEAAAAGLVHRRGLVVDPVLVTSSGTLLAPPDEVGPIARWLFPLAEVVTPNLPEASVLLGGVEIGTDTLLRWYTLHVLMLPFVVVIFMAIHFWRVRKDGGISGPL